MKLQVKMLLHQKLLQEECSLGTGAIGIQNALLAPARPETLCKGAEETNCFRDKLLQRHLGFGMLSFWVVIINSNVFHVPACLNLTKNVTFQWIQ